MNKNYYAVLMAGGVGSRFWPISTSENPKQFDDMLGTGDTLIQKTFKRLNKFVPTENILILTNERYNDLVLEQLQLVKQRRDGTSTFYRLDDEHIEHLLYEGNEHVEDLLK